MLAEVSKNKRLIKICGITRKKDYEFCIDQRVDFIGFIFAENSPRCVAPEFVASLPNNGTKVGVFTQSSAEIIASIYTNAKLQAIQLHAKQSLDEGLTLCRNLKKILLPQAGENKQKKPLIIKVFWPQSMELAELQNEMDAYASELDLFLLDAGKSGGGSGKRIDLTQLSPLAPKCPWLLAGGIGPDNLEQIIKESPELTNFAGFDLNSALEDAPGLKNHEKVTSSVKIIRNAINNEYK